MFCALGVFVLCWLYVFPVYRLPDEKEIVQGVLLQQGKAWRRNQTAVALFSGVESAGEKNGAKILVKAEASFGFDVKEEDHVAVLCDSEFIQKLLEECCDPGQLFAMTKMNSPMGKNLWFDGEFLYSVTIDNATYSLLPQGNSVALYRMKSCTVLCFGLSTLETYQTDKLYYGLALLGVVYIYLANLPVLMVETVKATPFQLPLKKCSVVGNGGILKKSGCGKQIDQADFVMRCNLPPLSSEYSKDVGSKTQLVTANPSIIQKRFQNLLWSRKAFVDSVKVYNHSYIYMPAFSMKTGTGPSLRVYYTLKDFGAKQAVLFANPNFLRDIGKFWKSKGIHGKRLSTGLFLVSAALGLCEEVTIYGFWPFSVDLHGRFISHHYYDNVLPDSGFHAMPEEFLQLWFLHKSGVLRMQLEPCEDPLIQPAA
ncbi:Alpha-N-acetylneuraminide alpha-2,8-sialyltransferase [Willisornis vidua]|uniref:Alpha-N-acetylneuraminide alpha-2,8-sialyltransferase n=1 Tax=Willisornis vidua TaxID=1566151 RepID=A0ABQ9CKS4_9PASS|nr:Alpha-N-acetylneuraminide alpha-2,8-sialyltransferase [Willisornis vidua]